jgi:hypothetical protein
MAAYLDRDSIEFLPLELFTDLVSGDAFETDLIVKVRFRGQASYFIIHIEHQGRFGKGFDKRVFNYFALIHRDYDLPVYPIVIFSHRSPKVEGDRSYTVAFPDWEVLRFNYRAIRLNHLAWQDFIGKANPVASAFMSKMKIRKQDRLLVKFECLRGLAELNLNPAQLHDCSNNLVELKESKKRASCRLSPVGSGRALKKAVKKAVKNKVVL